MTDRQPGVLRPSDRRLLLGYGPALVIGAAFLLMALLVPTVAPEQNVSAGTGSGSAQGPGAATGLPVSGSSQGAATATGSTGGGSTGSGQRHPAILPPVL